jgi:PAS domain-containing protein
MGLLLETRSDAAPGSDDAFLVIDSRLTVQAVSRDAERLLGINEDEMVDGPVTQFLGAADAEAREPEEFLYLLHRASTGADELHSVFVRPRNAFGVRIVARIAPCGPPRAALVVLGRQAPRSGLRVVSDD